jgi:dienelactone hydrolase
MSRIILACALASILSVPAKAQEKVSFPSADGTLLTGYLYKPAGPGPFAAAVGLHGCGGLKATVPAYGLYEQWGKILSGKGYFALFVDSLEPRRRDTLCGETRIEPLTEVTRDAVGGLNYLQSRPDVRPDSIVIIGWSYGANATMLTIANGALPERDFRAAIAFYPGCRSVLDAHWRPRLPMLLLMGDSDNVVRPAVCKELADAVGPPIDAHFYPNAHHLFDHPTLPISASPLGTIGSNPEARADAINRVTQFLAKQLQ